MIETGSRVSPAGRENSIRRWTTCWRRQPACSIASADSRPGWSGGQAAAQDLSVGDDGGERVVDLVGDAGGDFADRGHAGSLDQVGLGGLDLGFHLLAVGDVAADGLKFEDPAAGVEDGPVGALQPAQTLAALLDLVLQRRNICYPSQTRPDAGSSLGDRSRG